MAPAPLGYLGPIVSPTRRPSKGSQTQHHCPEPSSQTAYPLSLHPCSTADASLGQVLGRLMSLPSPFRGPISQCKLAVLCGLGKFPCIRATDQLSLLLKNPGLVSLRKQCKDSLFPEPTKYRYSGLRK